MEMRRYEDAIPLFAARPFIDCSIPVANAPLRTGQIWCWIGGNWDSVRIYTYYLLIWICIVGSILCYLLVGFHVFRSRNRLRSFSITKSREAGQREWARLFLLSHRSKL